MCICGLRWSGIVVGVWTLAMTATLTACHDQTSESAPGVESVGAPLVFAPRETIQANFGSIRDVAVAADGRVFVADAQRPSIWCFDSEGRFVGYLGREGRGPGEFKSVLSLAVTGDRLFALDAASQKITSFRLDRWIDGVPADTAPETFTPSGPAGFATGEIEAVPGGNLLVQLALPVVNYDEVSTAPRLVRLFSPTGEILRDSVMSLPNDEHLVIRGSGGGYTVSPMPFGKRSFLGVAPDGTMYSLWSGDVFASAFDPDGARSGTLTVPGLHARPVTSEDLTVMRASIVGSGTSLMQRLMGKQFDEGMETKAIPDSMPTVSSFVVDDQGDLWLTPVTGSDEQVSTSAGMVFRPRDGQAEVRMLDPRTGVVRRGDVALNGRLEAVVAGRLYFVTWDSLDVESIQAFDVEKR